MTEVSRPPEYARTIFTNALCSTDYSHKGHKVKKEFTSSRRVRCDRRAKLNSVAEGNLDVAGRLHHLAVGWNEAQAIHGVGDWHMLHLVILITHHRSEVSLVR